MQGRTLSGRPRLQPRILRFASPPHKSINHNIPTPQHPNIPTQPDPTHTYTSPLFTPSLSRLSTTMSSFLLRRATAASAGAARSFSTSSPRSLARITVIGNLADTPEVQTTSSGREILKYAVASNHGPRDNRQTSWFRITSFVEGPRKDYMLTLPKGYVACSDVYSQISSFSFSSLSSLSRVRSRTNLASFDRYTPTDTEPVQRCMSKAMPPLATTKIATVNPEPAWASSSVRFLHQ